MPLVVVAGTFFLPMAQACDHGVSPLKYIAEDHDALATIWIAPTFAVAAVLAIAVMRSWRAKAKNALAFAVMGAFALTLPVFTVMFGLQKVHTMSTLYAVAAVGTIALLERARRKRGWERLSALLDAYAVAAFPLATTIAWLAQYSGAYIFVVAYVAFATQRALVAIQSVRGRRARTGDARAVDAEALASDRRLRVAGDAGRHDELHARIGPQEDLSLDPADEDVTARAKAASS